MGYKTTDLKEAAELQKERGLKVIGIHTERNSVGTPTGRAIFEFEKNKDEIYGKEIKKEEKGEPIIENKVETKSEQKKEEVREKRKYNKRK